MTEHLGGPESVEQMSERHERFVRLADSGKGRWFKIVDEATGENAGSMHAFPSVDNGPSNAICKKLGFILLGEEDFEYPKGSFMRSNDWRLDLSDRLQE
jgi:hypothetical protein